MSVVLKFAALCFVCLLGAAAWLGMHEPPAPKTTGEIVLDGKNFLK